MIALSIRGLLSRKLRAALTALAVFLGTAMIAGTLMLTDSVNRSFDDIFAEANEGTDVSVRARLEVEPGFDAPQAGTALPEEIVDEVRQVDGVASASGAVGDGTIAILDEEGERIGPPEGGPPHIAFSVQPEPFSAFNFVEGSPPNAADEVGIDSITADEEGYEVGDTVTIAGTGPAREYTISGIARFGTGVPLAGASLVALTFEEAQRLTGKEGQVDEVTVEAEEGTTPEELERAVADALGARAEVMTGEEVAAEDAEDLQSGFSFLTTSLLVFAGIALFVGAFLIFNTFSITVAQRTREFAMLRTLGASGRQVLATVVLEAAILGLVAAALGIVGGLLFVELLTALFSALGFELPSSGLVIGAATIVVPLIVGVAATVLSALVPALRATRVAPLQALQTSAGARGPDRPWRRRILAPALIAVGVAALLAGLFATDTLGAALQLMGLGVVLLFVGVAIASRHLVRPLASAVGWPLERLRGVTGRLARENTLRNPGRTATTAAALMIGVALVTFVAVFAAAITRSVANALDRTFTGDVAIVNVDGFSPISPGIAERVREIDGVASVSQITAATARLQRTGENTTVAGIDPATIADVGELDWQEGSDATLAELDADGAIAESDWAEAEGLEVGDAVTLTAPDGGVHEFTIEGTILDRIGLLIQTVGLTLGTLREDFDARQDSIDLVSFEAGASFEAVRAEIDQVLASQFPNAETRSQQQLKDDQREAIDQLLVLIYALLALSVFVSLIGVANTLALTIRERTRELGMLRAIGTSRRQVRRLVRYESVITALIGAILGAALGLLIAIAAVIALEDEGLVLSIPVAAIVMVIVLAGLAGVLTGIGPARRASRVNVIEALQYE